MVLIDRNSLASLHGIYVTDSPLDGRLDRLECILNEKDPFGDSNSLPAYKLPGGRAIKLVCTVVCAQTNVQRRAGLGRIMSYPRDQIQITMRPRFLDREIESLQYFTHPSKRVEGFFFLKNPPDRPVVPCTLFIHSLDGVEYAIAMVQACFLVRRRFRLDAKRNAPCPATP